MLTSCTNTVIVGHAHIKPYLFEEMKVPSAFHKCSSTSISIFVMKVYDLVDAIQQHYQMFPDHTKVGGCSIHRDQTSDDILAVNAYAEVTAYC